MPLDLRRKVVFIHIPKTAGTAIELALEIKSEGANGEDILWGPAKISRGGSKQHYTYQEILDDKPHTAEWPAFAVVRNPWDRMVSGWAHHPKWKQEVGSFADFVNLAKQEVFVNNNPNWLDGYVRVQSDFIRGHEEKIYVLKFEDLQKDFGVLTAKIDQLSKVNPVLPRTSGRLHSTGIGADYRTHYTPELANIVLELYKEDIEKFGYQFSGE